MTISPDALMIFKAREGEENESNRKKITGKKPVDELMLPIEEKEKMLSGSKAAKQLESTTPSGELAKQAEPLQKQQEQKPIQQAPSQKQPEPKPVAQPAPQPQKQPVPQQKPAPKPKKAPSNIYVKVPQRDAARLSRDAAKGKNCVWHSWRQAYAMCAYCNRPFCFEDTIEFNRRYYCLEDIDGVSYHYTEKINQAGARLGYVSGFILLVALAIFVFYGNSSIMAAFLYLRRVGLLFFLFNANYTYSLTVLETLAMVLAFMASLLLFRKSGMGFLLGVVVSLVVVLLFSYQYTISGVAYYLLVGAFVFLGFVVLLYSRAVHINSEDVTNPKLEVEREIQAWPNVGRF